MKSYRKNEIDIKLDIIKICIEYDLTRNAVTKNYFTNFSKKKIHNASLQTIVTTGHKSKIVLALKMEVLVRESVH